MILIDSSGWIEYYTAGPLASVYAKYVERPSEAIIPSIVIYEVYKKLKQNHSEPVAISAIAAMQQGKIIPLTDELALIAADFSLQHQLAMADAIVYAAGIQERVSIVTSDKDLKDLPGVIYYGKSS